MVFALDETNALYVFTSEAELQQAFEGVDVEGGIYRFFDDSGRPLVAEFITPNQRGKIIGKVNWVQSGRYRLVPALDKSMTRMSELLGMVSVVEPNHYFQDIEKVRKFVAQ